MKRSEIYLLLAGWYERGDLRIIAIDGLSYGLCNALLKNFSVRLTEREAPELYSQKPHYTDGRFWWKRGEDEPRINALMKAHEIAKSNGN